MAGLKGSDMKTKLVAFSPVVRNSNGRFTNSKDFEKRKEKVEAMLKNKTALSAKREVANDNNKREFKWNDTSAQQILKKRKGQYPVSFYKI